MRCADVDVGASLPFRPDAHLAWTGQNASPTGARSRFAAAPINACTDDPLPTSKRAWRVAAKVLHEVGSIGYGGALAACLVIDHVAVRGSAPELLAARRAFAAIAQYVLLPSMAIVVVSGLLAMLATRAYLDAVWAWVKALLGLSVFEATLLVVGSGQKQAELAAAVVDPAKLDALLRAERGTLWLLLAVSVANVVLAVWRPRLTVRVR